MGSRLKRQKSRSTSARITRAMMEALDRRVLRASTPAAIESPVHISPMGATVNQSMLDLDSNSNGSVAAVWIEAEGSLFDPSTAHVKASLLNSSGQAIAPIQTLGGNVDGLEAHRPRIALNDQGGWVATWIDASGIVEARQWSGGSLSAGVAIDSSSITSELAAVACDAAGNFAVAWQTADASPRAVKLAIYDHNMAPVGGSITLGSNAAALPSIAANAAGQIVVLADANGAGQLTAWRYSMNGVAGASRVIAGGTVIGTSVALADDGAFVAAWLQSNPNNTGYDDGRLAKFSANDQPIFSVTVDAADVASNDSVSIALDEDDGGDFVVAWEYTEYTAVQAFDAGGDAKSDSAKISEIYAQGSSIVCRNDQFTFGSVDVGNVAQNQVSLQRWNFDGTGIYGAALTDVTGTGSPSNPGVAGATIYIDANQNGALDAGERSTVSGADGNWYLPNVSPAVHHVRAIASAGYRVTYPNAAGAIDVTVSAGTPSLYNYFGFTTMALISGRSWTDANSDGVFQSDETALANQRVWLDENNNAQFDTMTATRSSSGSVPFSSTSNGNSSINVSGLFLSLANVTVTVNVASPTNNKLQLYLTGPGAFVSGSLAFHQSGSNFTSTTFDDSASQSISAGTAPYTGSYRPSSTKLSDFANQNPNGTWTLHASLDSGGSAGAITSWSITISAAERNRTTDSAGQYSFGPMAAGAYFVRSAAPVTYATLAPAGNGYTTTLGDGQALQGDFRYFPQVFSGDATAADTWTVRPDPTQPSRVQIFRSASTAGTPDYAAPFGSLASLTFNGLGGNDTLIVGGTLSVPVTFNGGTGTSDLLDVAAGTFALNVDASLGSVNPAVQVEVGARLNIGAAQHLASLKVFGAAAVTANGTRLLGTKTLSIGSAGKLDLNDNDLIVTSTPKSTVEGYVLVAYNYGGWDGAGGIFSSAARDNSMGNTTLGLLGGTEFNNNNGGLFNGLSINNNDVLVKYTYFGDVDFNGAVDSTDYNLIDFGYLTGAGGWANGDVDYSGAIDSTDYNLIDFAFVSQSGTL